MVLCLNLLELLYTRIPNVKHTQTFRTSAAYMEVTCRTPDHIDQIRGVRSCIAASIPTAVAATADAPERSKKPMGGRRVAAARMAPLLTPPLDLDSYSTIVSN